MLLASSPVPWYFSATLWASSAVIVAVIAILVSVIFWYLGSPPGLIIYGLTSETALLNADTQSRSVVGIELKVTFNGQAVVDPHVVSTAIVNRGRRDIRRADF